MPTKRTEPTNVHALPFSGDDAQLVESLRQGHTHAVAHFYRAYVDQVYSLLFRMLGNDSELEDAVHDTFLRALESIHTLREPKALRGWLMGIAIFTAKIRIQKQQRRRWLELFAPANLPELAFFDPSPELGEAVRALTRVMSELPADERIAVVLRLAEGLTMSEAADACQVSISTLKRRFGRGQAKLRALIAEEPALQDWLRETTSSA